MQMNQLNPFNLTDHKDAETPSQRAFRIAESKVQFQGMTQSKEITIHNNPVNSGSKFSMTEDIMVGS